MGHEILLDDVLVRTILKQVLQSLRRQILRLSLKAVHFDDMVEGLLGFVHWHRRDVRIVLDDNRRPLSRDLPLVGLSVNIGLKEKMSLIGL